MPFARRRTLAIIAIGLVAACSGSSPAVTLPSTTSSVTSGPTATIVVPLSYASSTPALPSQAVRIGEPWIVYQWMAGDGDGLYLVRPDGSQGHRILGDLPPRTYHPAWSPDGGSIAFAFGQDHSEIWRASAEGTGAKKLVGCDGVPCQWVDSAAWSPDGTKLAYVRLDDPAVSGSVGSRASIEVFDIATGTRQVVARPPADGKEHREYILPRWSPDGRQIVFAMTHEPVPPTGPLLGSSIAVVKADGTQADAARNLTDPRLFGGYPDWSPDGQRILFNTHDQSYFEDTTLASNLYTIRPDGTDLTQLTHFGDKDARATQASWSPDGKQIVFCHITYDPTGEFGGWGLRHIAFIDPDGSNLTVLDGQYATHPRLRPVP
jgi:Tol biopolymer transport system component